MIEWLKKLLGVDVLEGKIELAWQAAQERVIPLFTSGDITVLVNSRQVGSDASGYVRGAWLTVYLDKVEWPNWNGPILLLPGAKVQTLIRYGGLAPLIRGVMTLENNDSIDHVIGSCRWQKMSDGRLAIVPMPARVGGEFHLGDASLNPDWPWNLGAGFSLRLSILIP